MTTESRPAVPPAPAAGAAHRSLSELRTDAMNARADLARTLDAIEFKLNLPRQFRFTSRRAVLRLRRLGEDNPVGLIGVAFGAAALVGTAVWLGVRAVQRD